MTETFTFIEVPRLTSFCVSLFTISVMPLVICKGYDTHKANLQHFWHCKFTVISPSICCNAFPMVPCTLPAFFIVNSQTLQFYCSTTLFIMQFFVQFCAATGLTAVCFTICMIQHVLASSSIHSTLSLCQKLLYHFNSDCGSVEWQNDCA